MPRHKRAQDPGLLRCQMSRRKIPRRLDREQSKQRHQHPSPSDARPEHTPSAARLPKVLAHPSDLPLTRPLGRRPIATSFGHLQPRSHHPAMSAPYAGKIPLFRPVEKKGKSYFHLLLILPSLKKEARGDLLGSAKARYLATVSLGKITSTIFCLT
jgi:hypothetical protein